MPEEKEKTFDILERIPQRHLTEIQKQYIELKIEQTRIERERARMILDKGLILYVGSLTIAILGVIFHSFSAGIIKLLIIAGICILVLSTVPYITISKKSEKTLDELIQGLVGKL